MENNTEVKATNEMEEVVAQMDNGQSKLKRGQLVTAIISSASDEGVAVLLPFFKKEILLEKDEIDCEEYKAEDFAAKVGDEIEVMVLSPSNPVKLSQKAIKQLKEEEEKIEAISNGEEFDVTCTGFNKGGLTSSMGTYSVFVPAKEIRMGYVKELDKYVGKKLRLKALEIKKSDRKKEIIASQRVILEEEKAARDQAKAEKEAEFFANIHVGDVVEGKVERATNFGAFVSVNGFDCLAHISDLSWTGVKEVTDVLEIGKRYQFKVLKIDRENKKVSIGYKQLQPRLGIWSPTNMRKATSCTVKWFVSFHSARLSKLRAVSTGLFTFPRSLMNGWKIRLRLSPSAKRWMRRSSSSIPPIKK